MKSRPILYSAPMVRAWLDGIKTQTRRVADFILVDADGQHADPDRAWLDRSYEKPKFGNAPCLKIPYGSEGGDSSTVQRFFPKWQVGDRLWGKETFNLHTNMDGMRVTYRADNAEKQVSFNKIGEDITDSQVLADDNHWRPSIFMSKWASRIHQKITAIRCQRVRDITEEDAIAEGIHHVGYSKLRHLKLYSINPAANPELHYTKGSETYDSAVMCYSDLWNQINLTPCPIYRRNPQTHKKEIVSYVSYPWSMADFKKQYPMIDLRATAPTHRGKPITILPNPWVWAITFKPILL